MRQHRRLLLGLRTLGAGRRGGAVALALCLALLGAIALPGPPVAAQELAPPRIYLEPDCTFAYGDDVDIPELTITLRGHNFVPGATIDIFSWEQDDIEASVVADEYGTFSGVGITVFQPLFNGDYRVEAVDRDSDGTRRAEAILRVPCPGTVTLTPNCGDPAAVSTADHQVRVAGSGWSGDQRFLLRFVTFGGETLDDTAVSVVNGNFEGTLQPGPLVNGLYAVIVARIQTTAAVALFPVPCQAPQVLLEPDCGPVGAPPGQYQLQLSGSGFLPLNLGRVVGGPQAGAHIEFMFGAGGIEQEFRYAGAIGAEEGSWGPLTITPLSRPAGVYNLRIRQLVQGYVVSEVNLPFDVPCAEPQVLVEPRDCAAPAFEGEPERRYSIMLRGSDFEPGPVEITFDAQGSSAAGAELFPATADATGSFVAAITPLARPVNDYEIHVVQQLRIEATVLVIPFRVPCEPKTAALSVRCDPLLPEPGEPAELVIEGNGFFELAPLTLMIGTLPPEQLFTDDQGGFVRRLPDADLPPVTTELAAAQRDIALLVVAEARTLAVLPCGTPEEPILRVLPSTASPGFVVTVEGIFFPANEPIRLTWDRGIGSSQPVTITPDANGLFRLQVLVYHRDFLGQRSVSASAADDPSVAYAEPVALLVVPGRGSPPAFVPPDGLSLDPETIIVIRR